MSLAIQPMKAPNQSLTEADLPLLQYPVLVSPKLDGLRAMGKDHGVRSKTLRRFDNAWLNQFFSHISLTGFDGEMVVGEPTGDDVIRRCGALRRKEGEPDAHWWLFDHYLKDQLPFKTRFKSELTAALKVVPKPIRTRLHVVEHIFCKSPEEVLDAEQRYLKMGFEGVMIRAAGGYYKFGRATKKEALIFKFKRFVDKEAEVTGFDDGLTNTNTQQRKDDGSTKRSTKKSGMVASGMIGAILATDLESGQPVRINPAKMTHDERRRLQENPGERIGHICTYRVFDGGGTVDKPRWPTWQCWRAKGDM